MRIVYWNFSDKFIGYFDGNGFTGVHTMIIGTLLNGQPPHSTVGRWLKCMIMLRVIMRILRSEYFDGNSLIRIL